MKYQAKLKRILTLNMGRDSAVGIATHYGLDSPGIESRWQRDFLNPSRPARGTTPSHVKWVPCLFLGVKSLGPVVDHPPPSSAKV
jgi:hypothetical protein